MHSTDMTDVTGHVQQGVFVLERHPVGCRPMGNDSGDLETLWCHWLGFYKQYMNTYYIIYCIVVWVVLATSSYYPNYVISWLR